MQPPPAAGKVYGFGWRHILAVLCFLAFFNSYMLRTNMNVAIVAMVNQTAVNNQEEQTVKGDAYCFLLNSQNYSSYVINSSVEKKPNVEGSFPWSTRHQGLILSSFYYGYFTQIIGGLAGSKFGGKWVVGMCILVPSILSLLTPLASKLGSGLEALIAIRSIEGLFSAMIWPATDAILARWVPPLERSKIPAFVLTGMYVGTVVTYSCSGYLTTSHLGWRSIFYLPGLIGCIWFVAWAIFTRDEPEKHKWITKDEKNYIIGSLNKEKSKRSEKAPSCGEVPWFSMMKSRPVIAFCISNFTWTWNFLTMLTVSPLYLSTIVGFNIKANGMISSLPYLTALICQIVTSLFADFLRSKKLLTTTKVRKLFDCSGLFINGISLLAITFAGCNKIAIVIMLCIAIGASTFQMSGALVNPLDIAPVYAGILSGISHGITGVGGMVMPSVVGILTDNNQTPAAWSTVFYVSFGMSMFAALFYLLFASGEIQPWASNERNLQNEEKMIISPSTTTLISLISTNEERASRNNTLTSVIDFDVPGQIMQESPH